MSVTLKLADEDAAVVGSILRAVSIMPNLTDPNNPIDYHKWYASVRSAHGHRSVDHLREIAGAFQIAVRANQR